MPQILYKAITVVPDDAGCWRLVRNRSLPGAGPLVKPKRAGYVRTTRGGKRGNYPIHRLMYERWRGAIPVDMVTDHLCKNRACVNPGHMEIVTRSENSKRQVQWCSKRTHCKHGHPLSGDNVQIALSRGRPFRRCLACKVASNRAMSARRAHKDKEVADPDEEC